MDRMGQVRAGLHHRGRVIGVMVQHVKEGVGPPGLERVVQARRIGGVTGIAPHRAVVPFADERLHISRDHGATQHGHLVAATKQFVHYERTEKTRATQYQDSHSPASPVCYLLGSGPIPSAAAIFLGICVLSSSPVNRAAPGPVA